MSPRPRRGRLRPDGLQTAIAMRPLRSAYHLARAVAVRLHPRHLRDTIKQVLHRLGLLIWYWRLRAFGRMLIRPFVPRRIRATGRWWRDLAAMRAKRRDESRLTVAVDVTALWEPLTGIGWYLYRLLEALASRDDVCVRLYGPCLVNTPDVPPPVVPLPSGPAIEVVTYTVPDDLNLPYAWTVRRMRDLAPRLIADDGNQVLFAPNYFLPTWFDRADGQLVATVHDLSFRRVPWTMRDSTRQDLAERLAGTVERATMVLTDTETVRAELIEEGFAPPEKIRAVHLGPGSIADHLLGDPVDLPAGTPPRYALHVGTLEPRKDLPTLLEAWRVMRADSSGAAPPSLVLCGHFGWKSDGLAPLVAEGVEAGWLHHFGYLEDRQVASLYRHAALVVMPSVYEGFGLPVVEAMRFGTPLLVSDIPVLREVADDAAAFAPPGDAAAWAEALATLLGDADRLRALAAAGRRRGARFQWSRTAEQTVEVWRASVASAGERA